MSDYQILREANSIQALVDYICANTERPCTIMEVCGTHTMSIARWGIKSMLPDKIKLVSGPGCPVCVTDSSALATAFALAEMPNIIFTCFGDMLRVPAGDMSLLQLESAGHDIRMVLSPMDALEIAINNPSKEIIFFAVGFETTAPLTAATIELAASKKVTNFSILCAHKTMPAAICALLRDSAVDALICPGHVAVVGGANEFAFVPQRLGKPAAIAGFEPFDMLLAIAYLAKDIKNKQAHLYNCYPRAVEDDGNATAQAILAKVFQPTDGIWRGLGIIPGSCLGLRNEYSSFDAVQKFHPQSKGIKDNPRCICSTILRGKANPDQCPLFAQSCTPQQPVGACMVSSEGSCAAAYKYMRRKAQ